ncbi:MAG: endonuclease/exonuclease/phosphatase family protein [Chloroflexota bacterium]
MTKKSSVRLGNRASFNRSLLAAIFLMAMLAVSCQPVTNFPDPEEPLYEGNYSDGPPDFDGSLKVVTWNIAFAEEIEEAIAELSENEDLQGADILLLQEMDESGTETMAQTLGYNYVYYPASIHSRHDKNFGNAILSKWPIVDSEKIILPHQNPRNDQIRIAVRALISFGDIKVPVYSLHTETYWLGQRSREDQIDYITEQIETIYPYALAGGDFNTLTPGSVRALEDRLGKVGFDRVSAGAGQSVGIGDLGFKLDHIFARGMVPIDTGVSSTSTASDHYPVWVDLVLEDET